MHVNARAVMAQAHQENVSMAGGKAHGVNRDYQTQCKDVLVARDPTLTPWAGDGIDVSFALDDTDGNLDVALRATDGGLVVAECRQPLIHPVKQGDIGEFAYRVEQLRKHLGIPVAGPRLSQDRPPKAPSGRAVQRHSDRRPGRGRDTTGITTTIPIPHREREQVLRDLMKSVASGVRHSGGQPVGLRHGTVIRPGPA